MLNWLRGSALVCAFAGPVVQVESWALRHANKCTPDQLIAAVFIENIARNFDGWRCEKTGTTHRSHRLTNKVKGLELLFSNHQNGYSWEAPHPEYCHSYLVKGVSLDDEAGRSIIAAYSKIKNKEEEVRRLKAKIKAEQEAADAKWNLAETLLGMKRVNGALVPAVCTEGLRPCSIHADLEDCE